MIITTSVHFDHRILSVSLTSESETKIVNTTCCVNSLRTDILFSLRFESPDFLSII